MNKSQIYIAAGLIFVATILIPASFVYAGKVKPKVLTKQQEKDAKACEGTFVHDFNRCGELKGLTPAQVEACRGDANADLGDCYKNHGVPRESRPKPLTVHTPEKATPGQKVEASPKPTPRDKAPSGKVLDQSSPTPKPTPSLKKKGNIEKQGM
jgi:hypothetical protein